MPELELVYRDADLNAIAAITGNGILARTADDTWALRTLVAPAAGLGITNNNGVGGNPTFALANDLSALEALATTGLAVRTGTDTWTTRAITGTANQVTVANGDGVAGAPTLSLPQDIATTSAPNFGGLQLKSHKLQFLNLLVRNNGGTIEHAMTSNNGGVASDYVDKITGASATWTATGQSTGAFTAGAVLLSGDNSVLILDNAAQTIASVIGIAVMHENTTSTALTIWPVVQSRTVNGVAQNRLELQFKNAATGAAFALNTTNITAGNYVRVGVFCSLA